MTNKKNFDLSGLDDSMDLELLTVEIDHIVINPDRTVYVVLTDEERIFRT